MPVDYQKLELLIATSAESGGSERGNFQPFVERLTQALGLEQPQLAAPQNERNDFVFERRVDFKHPNGTTSPGYIDLYKRNCFVMEAKQSSKRVDAKAPSTQLDLLPEDARQPRHSRAGCSISASCCVKRPNSRSVKFEGRDPRRPRPSLTF